MKRSPSVQKELNNLRRRVEELERRPPVIVAPVYVPPITLQPYVPYQPYAPYRPWWGTVTGGGSSDWTNYTVTNNQGLNTTR